MKSLGAYCFSSSGLTTISLNEGFESVSSNWILNTHITGLLVFPTTMLSIGNMITKTNGSPLYDIVCLAITPPSLTSTTNNSFSFSHVYVPDESVSAYKSASVWSNIASKILPLSDLED